MVLKLFVLSLAYGASLALAHNPCFTKFNWFGVLDTLGSTSRVCTCNVNYCDDFPEITKSARGTFQIYETSKSGKRFEKSIKHFSALTGELNSLRTNIKINPYKSFQKIVGFGSHFTDSVGLNIESLPLKLKKDLMNSIFGKSGNEFNLCRVPMGGTDQSTRAYSYDDTDVEDPELSNFDLTDEDLDLKIPLIKEAMRLSNNTLKLIAVPYSPPLWMKSNGAWTGRSELKTEYYQTYANYFIKFLEAYELEGIKYWGISSGNAPSQARVLINNVNSLGWQNNTLAKWIAENLGPTLKSSKYKDLKIYVLDDVRSEIPQLDICFENDECIKYVDGVGVQWYGNYLTTPDSLRKITNTTNTARKKVDILATAAANGAFSSYVSWIDGKAVELGSWRRAANYIEDIILNLQYGASGWLDYLLVSNMEGGVSWTSTAYDSPIIVNPNEKEFYKQPMYYALSHFSKFLPTDSQRIDVSLDWYSFATGIQAVAFKRPDSGIVVIIYNRGIYDQQVVVNAANRGGLTVMTERNSIMTVLYY